MNCAVVKGEKQAKVALGNVVVYLPISNKQSRTEQSSERAIDRSIGPVIQRSIDRAWKQQVNQCVTYSVSCELTESLREQDKLTWSYPLSNNQWDGFGERDSHTFHAFMNPFIIDNEREHDWAFALDFCRDKCPTWYTFEINCRMLRSQKRFEFTLVFVFHNLI